MEDNDETHSPTLISVTVAATAPLAIALPAQQPRYNGYGAVGSREDCWTESATSTLIDAWGERYLQLSRGNLKQNHWKEVAEEVRAREEHHGKVPKTDVQCKNRIDTVKKKFKAEKAKIAEGGGRSLWTFYERMDRLIGHTGGTTPNTGSKGGTSMAPPTKRINTCKMNFSLPSEQQFLSGSGPIRSARIQNQELKKRKSKMDSDSDPDPLSPDSTDSLPPETKYPYKRARTHRELNRDLGFDRPRGEEREGGWGDSVRELTRAIVKFGEMYEKAEMLKVQQMVEMEKQRMKFTKEIEIQRMQFFTKTQLEIKQNRRMRGNRNNSHLRHCSNDNNHDNNIDNNCHSDSSS